MTSHPTDRFRRQLSLAAVLSLALAGTAATAADCPHAPQTSKATPAVQAVGAAHAQPAWVRMASKPSGSGVRVSFTAPKSLAVGERGVIELMFSGVTEAGASVRLGAPAGASLVNADGADVGFVALPVGETTRLTLFFTPGADGGQTVDLFTEQDGRSSAQSIALKVGSGAVSLKSNGSAKTAAGGERVISMPAQTTR